MEPGDQPQLLIGLTPIDQMLISQVQPALRVYQMKSVLEVIIGILEAFQTFNKTMKKLQQPYYLIQDIKHFSSLKS